MPASDKFRDEIQKNNFFEALKTALSEAIELEIVTWVVPADQDELGQDTPEKVLPGHRMRTRINLVDGDIDNEIGSYFVGSGPYTELRQFHLEQVQKGQDIIHKNLMSLKQLFDIFRGVPQKERLLTSDTMAEAADPTWPTDDQRAAILPASDAAEEADSALVSGSAEPLDVVSDDEVITGDAAEEADSALVSGSAEPLDVVSDDEVIAGDAAEEADSALVSGSTEPVS